MFADGLAFVERRTGWPCLGLVHWLPAAGRLPAEDAASIRREGGAGTADKGAVRIVAPMLSRMANFDDAGRRSWYSMVKMTISMVRHA